MKKTDATKAFDEDSIFLAKLQEWVNLHPSQADAVHVNITTGKEFTIRGVFNMLIREAEIPIIDPDILAAKKLMKAWLGPK